MAVERDNKKLSGTFKSILNSVKDSINTRMDSKTGVPYVKGKGAHSEKYSGSYPDSVHEYESDPDLNK